MFSESICQLPILGCLSRAFSPSGAETDRPLLLFGSNQAASCPYCGLADPVVRWNGMSREAVAGGSCYTLREALVGVLGPGTREVGGGEGARLAARLPLPDHVSTRPLVQ